MPPVIRCYHCGDKIGGYQKVFYCSSGVTSHYPRFYCATCVLCQIQVNLRKRNNKLGENKKLSGDTLIENVGKLSIFTLPK